MALSMGRTPYFNLESSFGKKNGSERHCFPNDICIDDVVCIKGIKENIKVFRIKILIDETKILAEYERLKLACQNGGILYNEFLWAFAGKDLLWSMHDWLAKNLKGKLKGKGAWAFRDAIADRVKDFPDVEFYKVIPEWVQLRKLIETT